MKHEKNIVGMNANCKMPTWCPPVLVASCTINKHFSFYNFIKLSSFYNLAAAKASILVLREGRSSSCLTLLWWGDPPQCRPGDCTCWVHLLMRAAVDVPAMLHCLFLHPVIQPQLLKLPLHPLPKLLVALGGCG